MIILKYSLLQSGICCFGNCIYKYVLKNPVGSLTLTQIFYPPPPPFLFFRHFTFSRTEWFKRITRKSPSKYPSQKEKECGNHVAGCNGRHSPVKHYSLSPWWSIRKHIGYLLCRVQLLHFGLPDVILHYPRD